jgi:hypothetical protein
VDNDVAGVVQFSQALYTVSETAPAALVTIKRGGGGASAVTVDFATSDGPGASGALAGIHYTATSITVTFAANQTTRTVSIPLPGNNPSATGSKFVTLTLSSPGGGARLGPRARAQLKIVDAQPTVQFAAPTYAVTEGGTVSITVERTGALGTVIVPFATSDGSGVAGTDYVSRTGSLTFAAGVNTLTFAVRTLPNTHVNGHRTVILTLGPGVTGTAGAALGAQATATLTIGDNDTGGVVQFSAALFNVAECAVLPCNATLTLSRTGGAASGVSVDFTTADDTALDGIDYTATSGTVTFAAGQASQVIRIPLRVETGANPVRSFSVSLSNPLGGGTLGARTTAQVRITDTR